MIGVMRTGFPVFMMSNRASLVALSHVISTSGVSHILINEGDPEYEKKLHSAIEDARRHNPKIATTVSYHLPWQRLFSDEPIEIPCPGRYDLDRPCLIIHSSGIPFLCCCIGRLTLA